MSALERALRRLETALARAGDAPDARAATAVLGAALAEERQRAEGPSRIEQIKESAREALANERPAARDARRVAYTAVPEGLTKAALAQMLAEDPDMTDILEDSGLAGEVTGLIRLAIGIHINRIADAYARGREE